MSRHGNTQLVQAQKVAWVGGRSADLLTQASPGSEEAGIPVLFHLATPSLPLPFLVAPEAVKRALLPGIRPLTYFRPGYMSTAAQPGRSVADAAADAAAVLDAWELEKVVMYGGSGGGPHALACAALMPERVAGVVIDGSPAPFELIGPGALDGMTELNRVGHQMATGSTDDLLGKMRAVFDPTIAVDDPDLLVYRAREAITRYGLPQGGTLQFFASLLETGGHGWADDVLAITKPWGFGLADVRVPVHVFYGSKDELAPPAHGAFLVEHLPHAVAHPYDGGHGALMEQLPTVVSALASLGKRST